MTTPNPAPGLPAMPAASVSPKGLCVLVLLLAVLGTAFVLRFAASQERHEIMHWQNKLGLIADSRASDVTHWLDTHFRDLGQVAGNPSLQLYLSVLLAPRPDTDAMKEEPAQEVFLRNLLVVTADKLGFVSEASEDLKSVHANVHHATGTGIAIVGMDGRVIVATDGLATLDAPLAAQIAQAPKGQASLMDMFPAVAGNEKRIGFVLPIYPIQGDATASQQIGMLVGVKTVGEDLLRLLTQPGATEKTLESVLLRRDGDNVDYLPAQENAKLSTSFSLATPALDGAYALAHPGDFARDKRDRQGHGVLMTSRAIAHSPWTLLLHVDRDEALAASDSWRMKVEAILFFALLAVIASVVAAWWYGTSKRAMILSVQTGKLAAHSMAQERLLRVVSDNQPEPIFIADNKNIVRFANAKAARLFHLSSAEAAGKNLAALLGPAAAKDYIAANAQALAGGTPFTRTHKVGDEANARILRSAHIPLGSIPIEGLPVPTPGVLVVDQDVTEVVNERERRERILRSLTGTLVQLVDARDPNAANHSAAVAMVAREVALSLGLEPVMAETAEMAGNLMNIGKIVVPSAVLTRNTALAQNEVQAIRDSMTQSASLLQGIEFDGPVAETLRQSAERYDGTGPLGLTGESILMTARIIAVANSFVGMVSPRSWRPANSIEQATALLLENIDTQFDRRVVIALINFVENKQGRRMLGELMKRG